MRKSIMTAAALAVTILAQSNCMAAYNSEVKNGRIVVTGTELSPGTVINLTAFAKGTAPENAKNLIAMTEGVVGEDGTFSVSFGVRTDKSETKDAEAVTVYIKEQGKTVEAIDVNYSIKSYNVFMDSLKSASAEELAAIFDNPEYREVMNEFGMSGYFEITSASVKSDTIRLFAGCLDKADITPLKVNSAYERAYAVALLNAKSDDAKNAISTLNPEFEGMAFNSLTDETLKSWLASNAKTRIYASVDDYIKAYELDNVLYIINNTKSAKMAETLAKYADKAGVANDASYKSYTALNTSKQGRASDAMVSALSKSPAKSSAELIDVIKSAINSGSNGSSGGSSSGGGGSSSSGGSSGVFSDGNKKGNITIPPVTKTDDEKTNSFTDMENAAWAKEAVDVLCKKGIVSGISETSFAPNSPVTREQFVKLVVSAAEVMDDGAESDFADADKNAWYYRYLSSGVKAGIVSGISETEFGIGQEITRQDAAVILYRAAKIAGLDLKTKEKQNFSDADQIAEYAKEAVETLSSCGVINGMGNGEFAPNSTCTRAQAAQIIYRLFFGEQE